MASLFGLPSSAYWVHTAFHCLSGLPVLLSVVPSYVCTIERVRQTDRQTERPLYLDCSVNNISAATLYFEREDDESTLSWSAAAAVGRHAAAAGRQADGRRWRGPLPRSLVGHLGYLYFPPPPRSPPPPPPPLGLALCRRRRSCNHFHFRISIWILSPPPPSVWGLCIFMLDRSRCSYFS